MLEGAVASEDTDERCEDGVLGRPSDELAEKELFERASGTLCSRKAPIVGSHVWAGLMVLGDPVNSKSLGKLVSVAPTGLLMRRQVAEGVLHWKAPP